MTGNKYDQWAVPNNGIRLGKASAGEMVVEVSSRDYDTTLWDTPTKENRGKQRAWESKIRDIGQQNREAYSRYEGTTASRSRI